MNYSLNVLNFVNSVHIFSEVTPYAYMYLFFRKRSVLPLYFDVCVCWSIFNHRTCGINLLYDRSSPSPLIEGRKVVSDSGGVRFKLKTLCSYPNSPSDSTLRYATQTVSVQYSCDNNVFFFFYCTLIDTVRTIARYPRF